MNADLIPELNRVDVKSPTEDGKLSFVMNTMVPRRLEQFDDIENDLKNPGFNKDKAYFYVNFQAGDFCGRSYKLPISELSSFMKEELFVQENFDQNFQVDEDGIIHLIFQDFDDFGSLKDKLASLDNMDESLNTAIYGGMVGTQYVNGEIQDRTDADNKLDFKKQNKLVIVGNGDRLNSEGLPEPNGYGVHVTYDPKDGHGDPIYEGPIIDSEGNRGPVIRINHDEVVPLGGWITRYAVGGYAKDQLIPEGTRIVEVIRQILLGDPKQDNVLCAAVVDDINALEAWTDIPWIQFSIKRNELWHVDTFTPSITGHPIPFDRWRGISANHQYIAIALPLSMIHEDSGTDELRVRLNEVYEAATPEFTYPFLHKDIKGNSSDLLPMYRVYYLAEPVTMYFDKLVYEFTYNDPNSPDYEN